MLFCVFKVVGLDTPVVPCPLTNLPFGYNLDGCLEKHLNYLLRKRKKNKTNYTIAKQVTNENQT